MKESCIKLARDTRNSTFHRTCTKDASSLDSHTGHKKADQHSDRASFVQHSFLDLLHWEIINLFHQRVVRCDTTGSTEAALRTVILVCKITGGTQVRQKNDQKHVRQRLSSAKRLRADGDRQWELERVHMEM